MNRPLPLLLALLTSALLLFSPLVLSAVPPPLADRQCKGAARPASSALLLHHESLVGQFPFPVPAPSPSCHQQGLPTRLKATARVLTAPTAGSHPKLWSFQLAADPVTGTTVLTLEEASEAAASGRVIYRSQRSRGSVSYARITRTRLLGLVQCEKIAPSEEAEGLWSLLVSGGHGQLLLDPALAADRTLGFAYSQDWQLWLGETAAQEVRILMGNGGCAAVLRSWQLARNQSTGRQVLVEYAVNEMEIGLPAGDEEGVFRLPTACYRDEL